MTRAFIVNVDVGSDTDFQTIAEEIHDALNDQFNIVSVAPWQSPNEEPVTPVGLVAPVVPPPSLPL